MQDGKRKIPVHFGVKRSKAKVTTATLWFWHDNLTSFQNTAFILSISYVDAGWREEDTYTFWLKRSKVKVKTELCQHFCVKVNNIAINLVAKRCKYKYWITFCLCSRAIWIALRGAWKLAILSDAIHIAREHLPVSWRNQEEQNWGALLPPSFFFLSRSELEVNKNIDSSIVITNRLISTNLLKRCQ